MTLKLTPEEIHERLKDGMTMQEIGDLTGKTRSAISGIIYRYRKSIAASPLPDLQPVKGSVEAFVPKRLKVDVSDFLDVLNNNCCRYIEGDVKDRTAVYCSEKAGRSGFCEKHHAICYKPIKQKEAA